jgi:hypothetical protein
MKHIKDRPVKLLEKHPNIVCNFCGDYSEPYMLKDTVWRIIKSCGVDIRKSCLSCSEIKLGRSLVPEDFNKAPINNSIAFGYRMGINKI